MPSMPPPPPPAEVLDDGSRDTDPAQTDWMISHESTIDAFSYVLASRQQKKFVGCAPNANYVVICELRNATYSFTNKRTMAKGI